MNLKKDWPVLALLVVLAVALVAIRVAAYATWKPNYKNYIDAPEPAKAPGKPQGS
ncbi:MAG TPA: hypothetical protein VGI95_02815 [Caulobacteraceae bacterium]|jgi:hypothetical protein